LNESIGKIDDENYVDVFRLQDEEQDISPILQRISHYTQHPEKYAHSQIILIGIKL